MVDNIRKELEVELLKKRNSRDYVIGVLSNAGERNWEWLLNEIKTDKTLDSDRILLMALTIGEEN